MTMVANGLVKLIEECGELQQIAAKKLAYFNTDLHPDGMGPMSVRLEEEIADVIAASIFITQTFQLNEDRIGDRVELKLKRFQAWHADPFV